MKLFNYPFVVIYRIYLKIGEKEVPHYFSIMILSVYQNFYISAVLRLQNLTVKGKEEYVDLFFFILLILLNYFRFIYKAKYKKILDATDLKKGGYKSALTIIFVVVILLVGLGLWVYSLNVMRNINTIG